MKTAIMQPYLFPYIGYFQLINLVEKFIIYDDVNFIKGGWINRNNLLINNKASLFTLSLDQPGSFSLINEIKIKISFYERWKVKFLRTIEHSYKKAPFYLDVFPIIENILDLKNEELLSKLATKSIIKIKNYLQVNTQIIETSTIYNNKHLNGQNRVLNICKIENTNHYINPIGGQELYSKRIFKENGIELNFMKTKPFKYKQFNDEFIPMLSIIDVLMFNSIEEIQQLLTKYELV
jgi:hypothetical protein